MQEKKNDLPNSQIEAIENGEVFSSVVASKKQGGISYPKSMEDGVVFIASNIKLMAKDGSNNVLSAIGINDYEGKVDDSSMKFFRPTTFEELVIAFQHTKDGGLKDFYRSGEENNTNLNSLICSFLKNNLSTENIDVKELAASSLQIKGIVDKKAQDFYDKEEDFFTKKIQKFQSKIDSLRLEREGKDFLGVPVKNEELQMGEVIKDYIENLNGDVTEQQEPVEMPVDEMIRYFNANKTNEPIMEQTNLTAENENLGADLASCQKIEVTPQKVEEVVPQ